MFIENLKNNSQISQLSYQSKYACKICFERAKFPITCTQCKHYFCKMHLKSINNRCPFCRLQPFSYNQDHFLYELIQFDKKKQREFMISHHVFKCLVEGCGFQGKYHKMDIHRRKCHRNQNLNEILFQEERQNARKVRALEALMRTIHQKQQQNVINIHLAIVLHKRTGKKVELKQIFKMLAHVEHCKHVNCRKIYAEETICFIGNDQKQLSQCPQAQQFLVFYDSL